jgi:hypothetical protein
MKKLLSLLVLAMVLAGPLKADEGMWLPALIQKLNINAMHEKGFKLSAEDLYSINNSSLKDAVVSIQGCTAEMISPDGLMLTNHHCAFGDIQRHSSVEHDYLQNGFWAKSKSDELTCQGKFARFLIRVEDVTEKVLADVKAGMTYEERQKAVREASAKIEREATANSQYQATVASFFESNQYFLFVYETYRDVRLVGAPPQSLGKFGGETDNWVWPRHTADFSIYRVYAGPDGKPAAYSKDNIPLKPKRYFAISIKGVQDGDFSMIMGYPGRTKRYRTSTEVQVEMDVINKIRVDVREKKLAIIKQYMDTGPKARLQYADKFANSANYYKYSIGQNNGLKNLHVIDRKKEQEEAFTRWVAETPERKAKYGKALDLILNAYTSLDDDIAMNYLQEALRGGPEIIRQAYGFRVFYSMLDKPEENKDAIKKMAENIERQNADFYKDYDAATDQKLAATLFRLYAERVKPEYFPKFFSTIQSKFKGNYEKFAEKMFEGTIFSDPARMSAFLKNPSKKVIDKDLASKAAVDIFDMMQTLAKEAEKNTPQLEEGRHLLVAGLMEMNPGKTFYPDANSTMRMTYGTVGNYQPHDGIIYKETTTTQGYLEKEIPGDDEFDVPARMKELILKKDFGRYANKKGELETCFISNNDITGGNSGSPVLNANGELTGIAFDGNWEAMSGDIAFEPDLQRTICVDIRFVLWVVDKFAGASHLLDEMTIVQ